MSRPSKGPLRWLRVAGFLALAIVASPGTTKAQTLDIGATADATIREIEAARHEERYSPAPTLARIFSMLTNRPDCFNRVTLDALREAWPELRRYMPDNPGPNSSIDFIVSMHQRDIESASDKCEFETRVLSHALRSAIGDLEDASAMRAAVASKCDYSSQSLVRCIVSAVPANEDGTSKVTSGEASQASFGYRTEISYQLSRWDYDVGVGIYNILKTNSAMSCPDRATLDEVAERVPILSELVISYRAADPYIGTPQFDQMFKLQAEQFQSVFGDGKGRCHRASEDLSWALQAHMVRYFGIHALSDVGQGCGSDWLSCFYTRK